jgi:integrase
MKWCNRVPKALPERCAAATATTYPDNLQYLTKTQISAAYLRRAVQVLLGHASIATTERYVAVDDSEMRAAMVAATL